MFKKWLLIIGLFAAALQGEEKTKIIVCENGYETFQWQLEFIKNATSSIELSACLTGGTVFRALMEAIAEKLDAHPDLQAYVLAHPTLLEEYERNMVQRLKEKYKNLHIILSDVIFNALPTYTCHENHFKTLVVDDHYFTIGGSNLDENNCVEGTTTPPRRPGEGIARQTIPAGYRDQDVVGSGPCAHEIREAFHKQFALWEKFFETGYFDTDLEHFTENHLVPLQGALPYSDRFENSPFLRSPASAKVYVSGPGMKVNPITVTYETLFKNAEAEIAIGNLYANPHAPVWNALLEAVNRNVKVTLITNGDWKEATKFCSFFGWSNRIHYAPLYYGMEFHMWDAWTAEDLPIFDTKIYEYQVPDVMYHKKVAVIDKQYTFIGSYNFGIRSHVGDFEINILIDSPEVAQDVLKVLERDKQFCKKVNPDDARKWYFDPITSYWGSVQLLFNGFF